MQNRLTMAHLVLAISTTITGLASLYLMVDPFISAADQDTIDRAVEALLAAGYSLSVILQYHFLGINLNGLSTDLRLLNCKSYDLDCRTRCEEIKLLWEPLARSGRLKSLRLIVLRLTSYGCGVGGIALAIATSVGWVAVVGVALCTPSIADWVRDLLEKEDWIYWHDRARDLVEKYKAFKDDCL